MIFSWFSLEQEKNYNIIFKKAKKTIFQTVQYMIFFFLVFLIWSIAKDKNAASQILFIEFDAIMQPIWLKRYWYVTTYLFLLVLSPVLRKMLMTLSEREHCLILIVGMVVFIIAPFSDIRNNYVKDVMLFVLEYCICAYYKWYPNNFIRKYAGVLFMAGIGVSVVGTGLLSFPVPDVIKKVFAVTIGYSGRYSVLLVLAGISLFALFERKPAFTNTIINKIASLVFGIYLFHENRLINITGILYRLNPFSGDIARILYSFALLPVLFVGGAAVEWIRKKIVENYK